MINIFSHKWKCKWISYPKFNHIYYENKVPVEVLNKIDSDTFKNVSKYNKDTYSGKFSLKNITGYKEPQDIWTSFLVTNNYNTSKTLF